MLSGNFTYWLKEKNMIEVIWIVNNYREHNPSTAYYLYAGFVNAGPISFEQSIESWPANLCAGCCFCNVIL